jgi:hypothetical protein
MSDRAVFAVRNGTASHVVLPRGGEHALPACRPGHVYLSFPFADDSVASAVPDPDSLSHLANGHVDLYHHARAVHAAMRPELGERVRDQAALRVVDCDHPHGVQVKRVHPSAALVATDIHLLMGAPSLLRKRVDLAYAAAVPGDDPDPFFWSSTTDLAVPSDTVGGMAVQCVNCSVRYQPLFDLRVRMSVGFGGMAVDRLRVSVGAEVATSDVMRYTVQGLANFVSFTVPLASYEFFTFRTLIAGFVPFWVTPSVSFSISLGAMMVGAVEFVSGTHSGFRSNYGFEYTRGGGFSTFSEDVDFPVREETEFHAWPARTNPRFRLQASLANMATLTFWSFIAPYAVLRSPELAFEYSLNAPFCEGTAGYRIDLSLYAFFGRSVFPGFGKKTKYGNFNFLDVKLMGGFPGGLFADLPKKTLAMNCFNADVGDDETEPILPAFTEDEVNLRSLLSDLAQESTAIGYTMGDERGAKLEPVESQLAVQVVPGASVPTVTVRPVSTDSDEATLRLPTTQDLLSYVRFCLPVGSAVPTSWRETEQDVEAAGVFGQLFPCDGVTTAFRTGAASGLVVGDAVELVLTGAEGEIAPIADETGFTLSWSASRAAGLPLRPTAAQFFVAEASSTLAPGLSDWIPVATGGDDDGAAAEVEGNTLPRGEAVLFGVWSQCSALCTEEERRRPAFCTAATGGDGSVEPCAVPVETGACRVFSCPRFPVSLVGDSELTLWAPGDDVGSAKTRPILTTPRTLEVRFVGGAPTDTFAVDVLVAGCRDGDEDGSFWMVVDGTVVRDPATVAGDLGEPGEEEAVQVDATPAWSARIPMPTVLGYSTAFRIRPVDPASGCTYWDHVVVTNEVVITSHRRHALAFVDEAGDPFDIRPALAASPASRLVLVGDAMSIFVGGASASPFTSASYDDGVLSWFDVDPGAIQYITLTNAGPFFTALGGVGPLRGIQVSALRNTSDGTVNSLIHNFAARSPTLEDGPEVRARFTLDGTGHNAGVSNVYWQCEEANGWYGSSACVPYTGTVASRPSKVPPFVTVGANSISSLSCAVNRVRFADASVELTSLGVAAPYRSDEEAAGATAVCVPAGGPGFRVSETEGGASSTGLSTPAIAAIAAGAACCCLLLFAALLAVAVTTMRARRGTRGRTLPVNTSTAPSPAFGGGGGGGGYPNAHAGGYRGPSY